MSETFTDRDWITRKQAAEYLQVSQRTIDNWVKAGKLPIRRISEGTIRISMTEVDRLLRN